MESNLSIDQIQNISNSSSSKKNVVKVILFVILLLLTGLGSYFLGVKSVESRTSIIIPSSVPIKKIINPSIMPSTTPQENKSFATITNSGSTNYPGYVITIYENGSGILIYNNQDRFVNKRQENKTYPIGWFNSVIQKLIQIGDVSRVGGTDCVKSVSFGTSTYVTYKGINSEDLQCPSKNLNSLEQSLVNEIMGTK